VIALVVVNCSDLRGGPGSRRWSVKVVSLGLYRMRRRKLTVNEYRLRRSDCGEHGDDE
jgi:hypothetical protein